MEVSVRTSSGNGIQFSDGDKVEVIKGSQWHTGETGIVIECQESHVKVAFYDSAHTEDIEWLSIFNVKKV